MANFVGQAQHTLDAKGRLVLPMKYRADFERGGYLTPDKGGCVSLWSVEEFVVKTAQYAELRTDESGHGLTMSRYFTANSFEIEVDRQGRFALPQKSREIGLLEGEVLVVGQHDHLELWNPARFLAEVDIPGATLMGSSL